MSTQVSFTADEGLKNKALEKAKREGVPLKAVLVYAMKAFVDGKIALGIEAVDNEPEVEELHITDAAINEKALKIAKLLK